ncbi:MAG: SCO6745 family protein [Ilumatobacteraceae bacterium]
MIAHKTWRTLEPYHAAIYFVPEAPEELAVEGLDDLWRGYFASRAAPMGRVGPEVVVATFFNFEPGFVQRSMAGVWDRTTPEALIAARLRAAGRMIRRLAPDFVAGDDLDEAAGLARAAAEAAAVHPEGRPLFAGHTSLHTPDHPVEVIWHAQTLLREFRGDGHIAALTDAGLTGCEALVTHAASGGSSRAALQSTRQWSDEAWAVAQDSLRSRGWLDADGSFTDLGRQRREAIEARTDELAIVPYAVLGEQRCARLRELVRPASRAMATAFG